MLSEKVQKLTGRPEGNQLTLPCPSKCDLFPLVITIVGVCQTLGAFYPVLVLPPCDLDTSFNLVSHSQSGL